MDCSIFPLWLSFEAWLIGKMVFNNKAPLSHKDICEVGCCACSDSLLFSFTYCICNSLWSKLHNLEGNHRIQVFLCKKRFFLSLWWICYNGNSCYTVGLHWSHLFVCTYRSGRWTTSRHRCSCLQAFNTPYSKCWNPQCWEGTKSSFVFVKL